MHNRYYFPAEVIAIVLAFYRPRCWYVPVVLAVVSTHQYVVFLTRGDVIPIRLEFLALVPWALLVALSWQLYMRLEAPWRPPFLKPHGLERASFVTSPAAAIRPADDLPAEAIRAKRQSGNRTKPAS